MAAMAFSFPTIVAHAARSRHRPKAPMPLLSLCIRRLNFIVSTLHYFPDEATENERRKITMAWGKMQISIGAL